MAKNLMCSAHKSNENYRDEFDRVFRKLPIRMPISKTGGYMRDKKKYSRKQKHKNNETP